ncbi:thioredoxin family protein [Candidatus Woesearchaeota archaeon]|nr:thioredoxin family protein [Candidatus Woesearchaeota archaeon]
MKIIVYGSGCAKCKKLFELTKTAAKELRIKQEIKYVTGNKAMQKIIELGAMQSPVLAVGDKIVMTGFTPDLSKIKKLIQNSLSD